MRFASKTVFSTLFACSLLCVPAANAYMYKWVDDKGEVHYGDSVPPEYSDKERKQINERGRTVKVFEAAKTPEEIAEAKRLEVIRLEELKKAEEQALRDNVLMATYSNEEDMVKTRDSKIASLEGLVQLTKRRIRSMNHRIKQLTEDAADYERSGRPVPEMLTRQIENIRTQTIENESFILTKKKEQDEINRQLKIDIERFRDLRKQDEK